MVRTEKDESVGAHSWRQGVSMTKHWLDIVVNIYIIFLDSCAFFESRLHSKRWTLIRLRYLLTERL